MSDLADAVRAPSPASPGGPAPKRLVFIINSMGGGGAERVVSTLANYLYETRGWRTTILTIQRAPVQYPLAAGVTVRALRSATLGVGPGRLLALPVFAAELTWWLRRERPDSVMSFLVRSNLTLALTRWFGWREPIFMSERCATDAVYHGHRRGSRLILSLIRRLYPKAAAIVAISGGVKEALIRVGVPGDLVHVVYNPQNLAQITAAVGTDPVKTAPAAPLRIAAAGRLTEQKDYPTLLHAFEQVCQSGVDARLVVLGEGPDAAKLKTLARRLRVDDRIEWCGWVPSPYRLMADCDLFVLTSRWEGFGNVIVEAMACGLPVISTDCESGPREILGNGRYGILAPVGDAGAVAAAIRRLAQNPCERAALRSRGLLRARDFDVRAIASQYADVLMSGVRAGAR